MDELGRQSTAPLAYEISEEPNGSPVVRVTGELDMTSTSELEAAMAPIIGSAPEHLVVDASGLEFADSSAIALLVRWANLIPRVEIRQPPELLRRVLARMGLADRLEVSP